MTINDTAIFNIAGLPNDDFIAEVFDPLAQKQNEVLFALAVNGLPGDPTFGLALPDEVGEQLIPTMSSDINRNLGKNLPDLVTDISFIGAKVTLSAEDQAALIDVYTQDITTGETVVTPVGVRRP